MKANPAEFVQKMIQEGKKPAEIIKVVSATVPEWSEDAVAKLLKSLKKLERSMDDESEDSDDRDMAAKALAKKVKDLANLVGDSKFGVAAIVKLLITKFAKFEGVFAKLVQKEESKVREEEERKEKEEKERKAREEEEKRLKEEEEKRLKEEEERKS